MALFSRRSARADAPTPTPPSMPRLRDVDERELEWIAAHVELLTDAGTDIDDLAQVRAAYDRSAAAWRRINPPERDDPTVTTNAIGLAFGEHLVRRTPLRWVIAEDEHGIELALHDARTRTILYPAKLVAERWMAEEPGDFLTATGEQLVAKLPDTRRGRRH
jgi:hypothetical protein